MRLAGSDHRIDQHAVIVDRGVARQRDAAGVAVDLDLDDMGAVGKRQVLALPRMIGVERLALLAPERGDLQKADGAVGARDDEASVLEADVGLGRLQRVGGQRRALGDDLVRGAPHRRAAHVGRARAAVSAARDDQVGVALAEPDAFVRHAQPMGEDLRERRLVALADMLRAGDQRHRAVGLEADVDILVRRAAGALDVIGEAQAAQLALGLALPAPLGEAFQVGTDQRLIEGLGKGAAVDLEAEAVGHRHGVGRHHVAGAAARRGRNRADAPRRRSGVPGCSPFRRSRVRA